MAKLFLENGDKVMQVKNNYDMYWEKPELTETGQGVFNGDLGTIEYIYEDSKLIKIKFDDEKEAYYEYGMLDQIEHAYATTIHKSQGSEFNVCVVPIGAASPMLLTRNLLYTGITRAKKLLVIIGSKKNIDFMVQNNEIRKRNTGLKYKLIDISENAFLKLK